MSADGDNTYALKEDGTVHAWGANDYGQIGNPDARRSQNTPLQVTLTGVTSIAAAGTHAMAVKEDGTAWAWGNNNTGQLGDGGSCGKTCGTPVQVRDLQNVAALAGGYVHGLAVDGDGVVRAWGRNAEGQLGDGSTSARLAPVATTGMEDVEASIRVAAEFAYDGDGLRVRRTVDSTTQHFAWDLSGGMPLLLTDGTTSYLYDDAGIPVEHVDSAGDVTYYHHDQYGSTRALTDSAGATSATFTYTPYGELKARGGSADTALRWNGQYQDSDTGLYYLRARYYDPTTAQFLTRDPLAAMTQEVYGYGGGSPLNNSDPLGLCWGPDVLCKAAGAVGSGIASGAGAVVDAANAALPAVHTAAGYVAAGATVCAVALSWTVVGGGACGAVALGAAGVGAASGGILYAQGRISGTAFALDAAGLALGGAGSIAAAGARGAAGLAAAARGMSWLRRVQMTTNPWYAKLGPGVSSLWWSAKANMWQAASDGLTWGARGLGVAGLGLFGYGLRRSEC